MLDFRRVALPICLCLAACRADKAPSDRPEPRGSAIEPGGSNEPAPAERDDAASREAAVRNVLVAYKEAILARDGARAANVASRGTHAYFESSRIAALRATEHDVRNKRLMDKLMILTIRVRVPASDLRTMTGRDLFAHAVVQGMVGKEAQALEPGAVILNGDTAQLGIRAGTSTVPPERGFRVVREDGSWKLDVMSITGIGEPALAKVLREIDEDQDVAIIKALEAIAGKPVGAEVWQPIDAAP